MPLTPNSLPREAVPSLSFACAKQRTQKHDNQDAAKPCKPKRPLSAYNLFFKHQRQKLLAESPVRCEGKPRGSHGKIGFASLARVIADKWKNIDEETRDYFEDLAFEDKARYKQEKKEWKKAKEAENVPEKATSTAQSEQLASLLQGVLADTLQDFDVSNDLTSSALNPPSRQSTQIDSVVDSQPRTPLSRCYESKEQTSRTLSMQGLNYSSGSSLDAKHMHTKCPAKMDSFSLLNAASSMHFVDNVIGSGKKHSTIGNFGTHKVGKAPDISELAAKLDDECIDLLCGWKQIK